MSNALVKGSLAEVARQSGGELVAPPVAVVLADISLSMRKLDAVDERGAPTTRHKAAQAALRRLQAEMPGQLALIAFSRQAELCPTGRLPAPYGTTRLDRALAMARQADNGRMRFVLISDGRPDDPDAALEVASQFSVGIDCIYIGGDAEGEAFLRQLAQATGGQFYRDTSGIRLLDQAVVKMLAAGPSESGAPIVP